jgi:hypothetical protein
MATQLILKIEHLFSKFREIHLLGLLLLPVLAYLVVLAIDTPHVAVAEEHCARSLGSRYSGFLAVVSADRRHYRQIGRMAKTALVFQPIDAAFSGTDIAGGQSGLEPLSTVLQFAGAVQIDIAWFHGYYSNLFPMSVRNVAGIYSNS